MLPILLLLVAVIGFTSMFGSAMANIKNGGTVTYNEKQFQTYANQQYMAEFGENSGTYEDNIMIVFLTNEARDGYYAIAWVGDNIDTSINKQFGNEYTAFGRTVQANIDSDYYEFSISKNLAMVVDEMSDVVNSQGLTSPFVTPSKETKTESHITNHSDLAINEETVESALKKFTEETEIPMVIVVDSMENVFGKQLAFSDVFTMLLFVGLAVVAVVMIVRRVKNRPAANA